MIEGSDLSHDESYSPVGDGKFLNNIATKFIEEVKKEGSAIKTGAFKVI